MKWTDYLHIIQGGICGSFVKSRPVESTVCVGLYAAYQFGSRWNKNKQDRVGFDCATFAVGYVAGLLIGELLDE